MLQRACIAGLIWWSCFVLDPLAGASLKPVVKQMREPCQRTLIQFCENFDCLPRRISPH
uniref:Bifunctional inhibitor/plant lipid transfer protein/seed storage helical domain-containing protein n=1 Tax=Setaria viridis TaxID=4556 RepID=A0A4U6V803_SETVI|nr:hypothetical protein SEVIR_3G050366v2 [Setaria viridis]